jgi:hypothetical protein
MRKHWCFVLPVSRWIPPFCYQRRSELHGARRPKTLTGSATAKLTRNEEALIRQQADEAGLTKSEWCREVLLQALAVRPETRLLLSELLALRMIVLRLQLDLIEGRQPTNERLKEVLDRAEASKHALAEQRIHVFRSEPKPSPGSTGPEARVR